MTRRFTVEYAPPFATLIAAAPDFIQREYEVMELDELQVDPHHGVVHEVRPSDFPNEYHMLFDWPLAWITYIVDDETKNVFVYALTNAKDKL